MTTDYTNDAYHYTTARLRCSLTVYCPANKDGWRDVIQGVNVFDGKQATLHQLLTPEREVVSSIMTTLNPLEEARLWTKWGRQ